jgi:hypothetical protein
MTIREGATYRWIVGTLAGMTALATLIAAAGFAASML